VNFFNKSLEKYKLIVFVKNKLITIDTILPLLLEINQKFKVKSKIVIWDDCAYNAIRKNVVIKDLINSVGIELFITKGEKRAWLRKYYIIKSLLYIVAESFFGAKIIHFGALNSGILRIIDFLCRKNVYYMSSGAYDFNYTQHFPAKKLTNAPIGENIITTSKNNVKFKKYTHGKNIYTFYEPRKRESWVEYTYSNNEYYFNKYHNDVDISKGVLIYILGGIDAEPHAKKLFHSTMDILSKIQCDIPILIKPHAYTETDTVVNRIAGYDRFYITYLHPSFLATKAKAFIANGFTNTFADAHAFGVTTIEYSNYFACYSKSFLERFNGNSMDPEYVDFFIDNDSDIFSRTVHDVLGQKYNESLFKGYNDENNDLLKSLIG
jgi:hypothetical protein